MHKIKLVISALILLVISTTVFSQNSTSSPYTRYGFGYMDNDGFGRNKGLGGSGIALRSNTNINPLNPASYTAIDTLSQIFEFGLMGQVGKLSDGTNTQYDYDVNLTDLGFAVPITKWMGFTFGLKPVTLIGYDYLSLGSEPVDGITYSFKGEGGISKLFGGISVSPINNLSLGIGIDYYFGSNVYTRNITFNNNSSFSNLSTIEDLNVSTFHPTFGAQYTIPSGKDYSVTLGAVFEPSTDLNATQTRVTYRSVGGSTSNSELLEQVIDESIGMGIPQSYGVGVAFEKKNVFTITGDYYVQNWKDAEFYGVTDSLSNRTKISGGVEYVPNYLSQSYFQRVEYRLGSSYSNNYFRVNGEELFDFGINFGIGLPLRYSKTRFNIAFEYGWMGTESGNLISENYGKLSLNFSLNNFWFLKRKFD